MSAQASAAVTPDVALKGDAGYFRVGLFSRNFNKNVEEVGRLGNENDTYLEFGPSLTLAEWYVENGDTRTLANLQVLQSKLNHPRQ